MGAVAQEERSVLEQLDAAIERWIETLRDQAETFAENVDVEQMERLVETSKQWAMKLDERLPPSLDPAAVAEIRGIMIGALRAMESAGSDRPLDILDDLVLRAESIRHIIRDALDEHLGVDPDDAAALIGLLEEWLPRITRKQLAELLNIDERTIYRWRKLGGQAPRRLLLVARLIVLLRSAWTPEGVVAWFHRPRHDLGRRRPLDVLDDPAFEHALMAAVREGRAGHGS